MLLSKEATMETMLGYVLTSVEGIQWVDLIVYTPTSSFGGDSDDDTIQAIISLPLQTFLEKPFTLEGIIDKHATNYSIGEENALGLSSAVKMKSGEVRHLIMLDFALIWRDDQLEDFKAGLVEIFGKKIRGYFVSTGLSYHFYALGTLLSTEEWREKLTAAGTYNEDVFEEGFITKALDRGFVNLRLTSCSDQKKSALRPREIFAPDIYKS